MSLIIELDYFNNLNETTKHYIYTVFKTTTTNVVTVTVLTTLQLAQLAKKLKSNITYYHKYNVFTLTN